VRDVSKAELVDVMPGRETLLKDIRLKNERRSWIRITVVNESGESLEGFGSWTVKPATGSVRNIRCLKIASLTKCTRFNRTCRVLTTSRPHGRPERAPDRNRSSSNIVAKAWI
jgi:hypothetical protein